MAKTKLRTMNMKLHDVKMATEFTDEGVNRYLVVEDYGDAGDACRRVRIPLYGSNVRGLRDVLRQWAEAMAEEAKAAS